jgi:hypothetical protein
MSKLASHIRRNVVAYLALFVALGGTSYAAVNLPANSVGTRQLKNHSVTPAKLDRGSIAGYVRDWAKISSGGILIASRPRAKLIVWRTGSFEPGGIIQWAHPFPGSCFAEATTASLGPTPTYASALAGNGGTQPNPQAVVVLSAPPGPWDITVNVAIICPQP